MGGFQPRVGVLRVSLKVGLVGSTLELTVALSFGFKACEDDLVPQAKRGGWDGGTCYKGQGWGECREFNFGMGVCYHRVCYGFFWDGGAKVKEMIKQLVVTVCVLYPGAQVTSTTPGWGTAPGGTTGSPWPYSRR